MFHAHIFKEGAVKPRFEDTLSCKMGKVDFATNTILKTHPYPVSLPSFNSLHVGEVEMPRTYYRFVVIQGTD